MLNKDKIMRDLFSIIQFYELLTYGHSRDFWEFPQKIDRISRIIDNSVKHLSYRNCFERSLKFIHKVFQFMNHDRLVRNEDI